MQLLPMIAWQIIPPKNHSTKNHSTKNHSTKNHSTKNHSSKIRSTKKSFHQKSFHQKCAASLGEPRTTNSCEGFNHSFQSLLYGDHPSIWKLMEAIRKDIAILKKYSLGWEHWSTCNKKEKVPQFEQTCSRHSWKVLQLQWQDEVLATHSLIARRNWSYFPSNWRLVTETPLLFPSKKAAQVCSWKVFLLYYTSSKSNLIDKFNE